MTFQPFSCTKPSCVPGYVISLLSANMLKRLLMFCDIVGDNADCFSLLLDYESFFLSCFFFFHNNIFYGVSADQKQSDERYSYLWKCVSRKEGNAVGEPQRQCNRIARMQKD